MDLREGRRAGLAERQVGNPGPGPSVEREGAVIRQGLDPFAVGVGLDLPPAEPVPHYRLLHVAEGCQFGVDLIDHPTPAEVAPDYSGVAHDPRQQPSSAFLRPVLQCSEDPPKKPTNERAVHERHLHVRFSAQPFPPGRGGLDQPQLDPALVAALEQGRHQQPARQLHPENLDRRPARDGHARLVRVGEDDLVRPPTCDARQPMLAGVGAEGCDQRTARARISFARRSSRFSRSKLLSR